MSRMTSGERLTKLTRELLSKLLHPEGRVGRPRAAAASIRIVVFL